MKRHRIVASLLREAQDERRCAFGATSAQRQALSRRAAVGELHKVSSNMYADAAYWQSLTPPEQTLHIARTLHRKHDAWRFGGVTAAAAHGFEHQWRLHDDSITIIDTSRGSCMSTPRNDRPRHGIHVKRFRSAYNDYVTADGLPVTSQAQTVVDCSLQLQFRDALPIIDSAFANGVKADDIIALCAGTRRDHTPVFQLLRYANPASENGGESLARGTIIEQRFAIPRIQVPFTDPTTGKTYRVDFMWRLADGHIIVGEFDGMDKYASPGMTGGRSIQGVVLAERERESALSRAGVSGIVRFTFDDVVRRQPLISKLLAAGIPRSTGISGTGA